LREKEYFKYLDQFQNERLHLKIKTDKRKVIDMVVQYESNIKGQWKPIVRYDCSHGFFHRDLIYPGGDKEKSAIAIGDLETALSYAEQDIKDHWEFYREKYFKELKK